jgi:hypothetical protein
MPEPVPQREPRQIATTRPTTCGCCRRPVFLLETVRSVTLVEITRLCSGHQAGEAVEIQTPHQCPEEAVIRWDRLAALARMSRRNQAQAEASGADDRDRSTRPPIASPEPASRQPTRER